MSGTLFSHVDRFPEVVEQSLLLVCFTYIQVELENLDGNLGGVILPALLLESLFIPILFPKSTTWKNKTRIQNIVCIMLWLEYKILKTNLVLGEYECIRAQKWSPQGGLQRLHGRQCTCTLDCLWGRSMVMVIHAFLTSVHAFFIGMPI